MNSTPPASEYKQYGKPPRKQISHLIYFLLPVIIIIPAGLFFFSIRMPEKPSDKGVGNIYFNQSASAYNAASEKSPLPMKMPSFIDPAHLTSTSSTLLDIKHENKIRKAPVITPFDAHESSVFLNKEKLLELPPASNL